MAAPTDCHYYTVGARIARPLMSHYNYLSLCVILSEAKDLYPKGIHEYFSWDGQES